MKDEKNGQVTTRERGGFGVIEHTNGTGSTNTQSRVQACNMDHGHRAAGGGLDRHLRGLSGSSPRSVLIKICANKKIGEERRGDYPEAGINLEYEGKTNLK
jgi:hypothetical protein